jgi:hypothetical protein
MQSIIFLDDDENRTASFLNKVSGSVASRKGNIHTPTTAIGAIDWIKAIDALREQPDMDEHTLTVFLDHDLGGEIYVDSNREDCGMEVVRWIVANKPRIEEIVVHTHNTPAGEAMVDSLSSAGYKVCYCPFNSLLGRLV